MRYYRSFAVLLVLWFAGTREIHAANRARTNNQTRLRDSISAGGHHTCQVMGEGSVSCWGLNDTFQLGVDNTNTSGTFRATPVTVPGLSGATSVASGDQHTCALLSNGNVRCWGLNASGQLGDGNTDTRSAPADVLVGDPLQPSTLAPLTNVKAIAAASEHTCALVTDGSVRCWGANSNGNLGNGTTTRSTTAATVTNIANAIAIAAGGSHTCAVISDGTAKCWGINQNGEIGDGSIGTNRLIPVPVQGLAGPAIAIAASATNTCAHLTDGTAQCWGQNSYGQIGNYVFTPQPITLPATVLQKGGDNLSPLTNITAISTGSGYACALVATGTARCWGFNQFGELGDGTTINRRSVETQSGVTNAVTITAGAGTACAVSADGKTKCWGKNVNDRGFLEQTGLVDGQLGNGDTTTTFTTTPVPVAGVGGSISAAVIAAGSQHTCAIRTNGSVLCWGRNNHGQLGDNTTTDEAKPVPVSGLANAVAITAGQSHTCVLTADGSVRCWGDNSSFQVGTPNQGDQKTFVTVGVSNAVAIAAGLLHTCALISNGTVQCWGDGVAGDLGNGQVSPSSTPVLVNGIAGAVSIASGTDYTCALLGDGTAKCWGANGRGQLGNGSLISAINGPVNVSLPDTSSAQQPPPRIPLTNITAIAADESHTCAVLGGGTMKCWGSNTSGEAGDGTNGAANDRLSPVSVRDLENGRGILFNISDIALGQSHSCARTGGGGVRCWGFNATGQLGDASTTDRTTPDHVVKIVVDPVQHTLTQVPYSGLVQIAAGAAHSCAVQSNGTPLCWGGNDFGQIGDTTTTNHSTPVVVPSFAVNIDPAVPLINRRVVTVTIIATCAAGDYLHVNVAVVQGSASGSGVGQGPCTGHLDNYPVTVPAQGFDGFTSGPAQAQATASVREKGAIIETQQWTRNVTIVP